MALTRADVESILVRRLGRMLEACSLDGTTINGTNADLSDPIANALRQLGYTVASRAAVADGDLDDVAADDEEALLDLAEFRTLESCLGNLDLVDVQVGPERESLAQLGTRLERAIERKRRQIERDHGIGLATLTAGTIALGFQQLDEGEER